jgi:predicted transcriptional regulator
MVNFPLDKRDLPAIMRLEVRNMGTISFAVKLSEDIRKRLKEFCDERGLKIGHFVAQALVEKMEREEMIEDAKEFVLYRHEEPHAVDYKDYLRERTGRERKKARA